MGASDGGGSMKDATGGSFEKNKLGRLGNEFDTYAEVGFGKELYRSGSQSVYIQMMINMYDGDTNSSHENKFGWENMNIQFRNFMGTDETTGRVSASIINTALTLTTTISGTIPTSAAVLKK